MLSVFVRMLLRSWQEFCVGSGEVLGRGKSEEDDGGLGFSSGISRVSKTLLLKGVSYLVRGRFMHYEVRTDVDPFR